MEQFGKLDKFGNKKWMTDTGINFNSSVDTVAIGNGAWSLAFAVNS